MTWHRSPEGAAPDVLAWARGVEAALLADGTAWARMQRCSHLPAALYWGAPHRTHMPPLEELGARDARSLARAWTTHRNGWLREPGVRWLGDTSADPLDLDLLLPRVADFVPSVAEAARRAVERVLIRCGRAALVDRLEAIGRLGERVRWSAGADELVLGALEREAEEVRARLPSENPWGVRVGLRVLERAGDSLTSRALLALRASDIRSGLQALAELDRAGADPTTFRDVLGAALTGAHAPIRAWAVRRWDQLRLDSSLEVLEAAVVDPARSVRWVGQYRLRRRGGSPAEVARARLAASPSVGAIEAVGETGDAHDIASLEPFLEGPTRVGRAALRAIAGLDRDAGTAWAVVLLSDPRPGVVREASRLLGRGPLPVSAPDLTALVTDPPHPHTARRVLPLLLHLPKFQALGALLRASRSSARDEAQPLIVQWLARDAHTNYSVRPDEREVAELLRLLSGAGLDAGVAKRLRFALGR